MLVKIKGPPILKSNSNCCCQTQDVRADSLSVRLTCVMFTLTRVHYDPAAYHFTWYYITILPCVFDVSQNKAFEGIPRKAHQVSASNLQKFSIKCTARIFYLVICVLNDYKHNSYLTMHNLKWFYHEWVSTFRIITKF